MFVSFPKPCKPPPVTLSDDFLQGICRHSIQTLHDYWLNHPECRKGDGWHWPIFKVTGIKCWLNFSLQILHEFHSNFTRLLLWGKDTVDLDLHLYFQDHRGQTFTYIARIPWLLLGPHTLWEKTQLTLIYTCKKPGIILYIYTCKFYLYLCKQSFNPNQYFLNCF